MSGRLKRVAAGAKVQLYLTAKPAKPGAKNCGRRAWARRPAGQLGQPRLFLALGLLLAHLLAGAGPARAASPRSAALPAPIAVVAESALAAQAGIEVMKQGGNAVDAAVATSLALGVARPASCGIGGGGFMVIYLARTGRVYLLDYRERAPLRARPSLYLRGGKVEQALARLGPLAVAVPGELAGLEQARRRFGTMPFSALAAPAAALARQGVPIDRLLAREIAIASAELRNDPYLAAKFLDATGAARNTGTVREAELAQTLLRLGDHPVERFYRGRVGQAMVRYLRLRHGVMSRRDLRSYRPIWRRPLSLNYHDLTVYVPSPPSAAGVVLEMLGMLQGGEAAGLGLNSAPYLARLTAVIRQGFADRSYFGDPGFVSVPTERLLSPAHLAEARRRAFERRPPVPAAASEDHGTSNFIVADAAGNVVVVTTTINRFFGAKLAVPELGIILNDEMDDFTLGEGGVNGKAADRANRIAPGKRPRSSMTPTIVLKDGRPVLALGGSGGPTILTGVLQVFLDLVDFHLAPAQAVASPRIFEFPGSPVVAVESGIPASTAQELGRMGYEIGTPWFTGAVEALRISPAKLEGAVDPRKGGATLVR